MRQPPEGRPEARVEGSDPAGFQIPDIAVGLVGSSESVSGFEWRRRRD
jgi:hypothetical protein